MPKLSELLRNIKEFLPIADLLSGGAGTAYTDAQCNQFRRSMANQGFGAYLPSSNAALLKYLRAVGTAAKDALTHGG